MQTDKEKGTDKKKAADASNASVAADLADMASELSEVREKNDVLEAEVKVLKTQLAEANAVIETDLREGLYKKIIGVSNYTRPELEEQYPAADAQSIKALQKLYESLSRGLGVASSGKRGTFKPLPGTASDSASLGTVPDLHGKDRATILKEAAAM